MPLPAPNTPWPPRRHLPIHQAIGRWDAWYTGDRETLSRVYGGQDGLPSGFRDHISQYRGGIVGTMARLFWGQPLAPNQQSAKIHVPVAADIAATSANLLFSEPPTLLVEDPATQARLDELLDEHWWDQILTAAELASGLGGVYLRSGWDEQVANKPLLSVIGPDAAVPTVRWGQLASVIFGWVLERDNSVVMRHLEHHGPGYVEHGLYLGDDGMLGRLIPLTEHPDTEGLAGVVDENGMVATGLPRLDVVYIANQPARNWRNDPVAHALGQPDIAGVERAGLLDSIDEIFTSLMRDVRLGRTRVIVPRPFLTTHGPGGGASFNLDQELFVGLDSLAPSDTMPVHLIQPNIRDESHSRAFMMALERIVTGCGFSAQTFGLTGEVTMTAAEWNGRERKTNQTRGGKLRRWRPGLADVVEIQLAMDAQVFKTGVKVLRPSIEFAPPVRDTPETLARTAQLLFSAECSSTYTRVQTAHPDWNDTQITKEVTTILAERGMPVPADINEEPTLLPL